jgi:hypothetical protein
MVVRRHRVDFLCMMIMNPLTILVSDHIMRCKYITHVLVHICIGHKSDTNMVTSKIVIILEMVPVVILVSYVP